MSDESFPSASDFAAAFAVVLAASLGCEIARDDYEEAVDVLVTLLEHSNDMVPKLRRAVTDDRTGHPDFHGEQ